jgi:O-antigen ligase
MISAAAWLVFVVACTVLAFARHPIYGLTFYIGTFFVHPPSRWWGYMIPDPRWALLSAGITVMALLVYRNKHGIQPPGKPVWLANGPALLLLIYTVWMWIQTPWALDVPSHVDGAIKYVKYLIAFWFIYWLVDSKKTLLILLYAHALGCGLLGVFALYAPREDGRLEGVGGPGIDDANTLAMYLASGAIVCMGLMMTATGWRRWFNLGVLALIGNGFVLANSRGAFLALVAGGLVLAVCKARKHRGVFWALALVGLVGFAFAVDKVFVERMFTIGDVTEKSEEADMSARSRVVIYEAQLRMAIDHPFGVGYRGTVVLSPSYLDRKWLTLDTNGDESSAGRSSHNTFMTALVEQGLPGAIVFLSLVLWILGSILQIRRLDRRHADPDFSSLGGAVCGGLVVVFVAGMATDYLMAEVQFWHFAALASLLRLSETSTRVGGASPALGAAPPHAAART